MKLGFSHTLSGFP
uniref:Uncharacterized protein n=1 Tax=Anguilla anguilla TaxID=7936 RepID=A0A0E9TRC1_ANGAN